MTQVYRSSLYIEEERRSQLSSVSWFELREKRLLQNQREKEDRFLSVLFLYHLLIIFFVKTLEVISETFACAVKPQM